MTYLHTTTRALTAFPIEGLAPPLSEDQGRTLAKIRGDFDEARHGNFLEALNAFGKAFADLGCLGLATNNDVQELFSDLAIACCGRDSLDFLELVANQRSIPAHPRLVNVLIERVAATLGESAADLKLAARALRAAGKVHALVPADDQVKVEGPITAFLKGAAVPKTGVLARAAVFRDGGEQFLGEHSEATSLVSDPNLKISFALDNVSAYLNSGFERDTLARTMDIVRLAIDDVAPNDPATPVATLVEKLCKIGSEYDGFTLDFFQLAMKIDAEGRATTFCRLMRTGILKSGLTEFERHTIAVLSFQVHANDRNAFVTTGSPTVHYPFWLIDLRGKLLAHWLTTPTTLQTIIATQRQSEIASSLELAKPHLTSPHPHFDTPLVKLMEDYEVQPVTPAHWPELLKVLGG
jgi:hypothetical protein